MVSWTEGDGSAVDVCPTDDGSAVDRATASAFDDGSFDDDQIVGPSISETADPFSRLLQ